MTELELLEKVEFRLAMAENETTFQAQLDQFLCPILLKLSSPNKDVYNKVIQICGHINKRFKASSVMELPIEKLIDMKSNGSLSVKSFVFVYLDMGFQRISPQRGVLLLPKLLQGIGSESGQFQTILFSITLPLLQHFHANVDKLPEDAFGFKENQSDLRFLIEKFQLVMLYTIPTTGVTINALNMAKNAQLPKVTPLDKVPAGLSKLDVKFITNNLKGSWIYSMDALKAIKLGILRFFLLDKFIGKNTCTSERFMLFLIASCDSMHEIQFHADDLLKRHVKPDYEEQELVDRLYQLYQGTVDVDPSLEVFKSPVGLLLKQKVVDCLVKSQKAAGQYPQMIKVAFDCLYGSDANAKLRQSGMAFVQWIAKMGPDEIFSIVGPVLTGGIMKMINEPSDSQSESLRGFSYESLGLLAKRVPYLFGDRKFMKMLFDAFSNENRNVSVSIQDALSLMLDAFKPLTEDPEESAGIIRVLKRAMVKPNSNARYAALKYAKRLFAFNNPEARFICLYLSTDEKLEIREEAFKGLEFPIKAINQDNDMSVDGQDDGIPTLEAMLECFERNIKDEKMQVSRTPGVRFVSGVNADMLVIALSFFRQLLLRSFAEDADLVNLATIGDEKIQWVSQQTRIEIQNGLKTQWNSIGIVGLLKWIDIALSSKDSTGLLISISSFMLLELLSLGPIELAKIYNEKTDWILGFLTASKSQTRQSMAHVLGIVSTMDLQTDKTKFQSIVKSLVHDSKIDEKSSLDKKHGSLLAAAFVISRSVYRYPKDYNSFVEPDLTIELCKEILKCLESNQNEFIVAGGLAMAELGRYAKLNLPDLSTKISTKLQSLLKSSSEIKVQEAAVFAIGHILIGNPSSVQETIDFFMTLPNSLSKQSELHFNVGEALCALLFGFSSTHMDEYKDISGVELQPELMNPLNDEDAQVILDKVLSCVTPAQSAVMQKAACIWLLCLTKYCGTIPLVAKMLLKFHDSFSSLLGAKDEFTQEIASKGIGLIYDIGDKSLKGQLVQALVSTFTDGKKIAAQSINNNTELFTGGALGASPDGENISTYKSILSLAADMNQPDMVYKFMSLASHHAIWNSRRGASMGFGSIAAQAEKELKPYLPKIVPKLYRYQFDPHPQTAQSMKNIWKTLVKDPSKTVDALFKEIMDEVLKGMGDRMWRTRESSCAALADLLHGKQLNQIEPFMKDLWTMCFRALDDIKESVRKAAFLTAKTLTNMTVRYCDPLYFEPKRSQKIMDEMIPFLLNQGLGNMAEEVRQFSLSTILKLCKTGGILLTPHVSDIICTFLESLSSLEPQAMNYLTFHLEKYNITQTELDSQRLSAAKASPIMDAIDQCSQYLNAEMMVAFVPRLCVIIKKGVGLPTRAGTARLIYIMVLKLSPETKVHADAILAALGVAIYDRNPIVRKSFSTATGYICKLASFNAIKTVLDKMIAVYLEAGDEDGRSVAPITILEISRHAGSALEDLHGTILPLAFMGSRDSSSESLKEVWTKVWEENTGGSSNAIKKWKAELFKSCTDTLKTNPSWTMKKQVGKALTDMANALGNEIISLFPDLLVLLQEALAGRTWDGKEAVLEALTTVVVQGHSYFSQNADKKEVEDLMIREAQKQNLTYRRFAIEYLGLGFDALKSARFAEVKEYLAKVASDDESGDEMDVDDNRLKPLKLMIVATAYKSIGLCFPVDDQGDGFIDPGVESTWTAEFMAGALLAQVWNIRLAILDGLKSFFGKLSNDVNLEENSMIALFQGFVACLEDGKYRSVREKAAELLILWSERKEIKTLSSSVDIKLKLSEIISSERDSLIQESLQKVLLSL